MLTYAPRPTPKQNPIALLLLLTAWLGLFCWTGPATAQFHFQDYGPRPRLTPPDAIQARGALLMYGDEILYARSPDERLLPASTTKLMTALIVYEKIRMKGSVTIEESDRAEPSNIPVVPGESISVNTLFHALLIESANDSARALGRYVAGSEGAFVAMMNERALAMGLFNTHFANPNGLPAPSGTHFTSCADLMRIFRAVVAYPELSRILSTKEDTIWTASGMHTLRNHNRLLGYYPGMGPAKTGWTEAARHTYACAVTQNGHTIMLTLLDSPNKWKDAQILFNWGFAQIANSPSPGGPAPSGLAPNGVAH
jgi:D-alanyl-D-alanine carboxypeptidase (penicillin-binding protein 5/6)